MSFKRAEFQSALILNNEMIDQYLVMCLRSSLQSNEQLKAWQKDLFTEIRDILIEPHWLPILKVSCAKFLIYLFYLGDMDVYQNIQRTIYPIIKHYAKVDKQLPFSKRGQRIFMSHPDYDRADDRGKQMIRILGVDFIRFFIQTVPVWANQFPTDQQIQTKPSIYYDGYQQLKRQGVTFPSYQQYAIYTRQNIQKREIKLKVLLDKFDLSASLTAKNSSLVSQKIRGSMMHKAISKFNHQIPSSQNIIQEQHTIKTTTIQPPLTPSMNHIQFDNHSVTKKMPNNIDPITSAIAQNMMTSQRKNPNSQFVEQHPLKIISKQSLNTNNRQLVPKQALQQQAAHLNQTFHLKMQQIQKVHKSQLQQTVGSLKGQYQQQIHQLRNVCQQLSKENMMLKSDITEKHHKLNQLSQTMHTMSSQLSQKDSKLNQFSSMIHSLSTQNAKITQQFQQMVSSTRHQSSSSSLTMEEVKRLKFQNYELKRNLLDDCTVKQEFIVEDYKQQKDRYVAFDFVDKLLISSAQILTFENRVRFKKCLLKSKGILFKNKHLEVGSVTVFKQLNIIKIKLCITNISPSQIHSFNIEFKNYEDIQFIEQQSPARTLPSQYQEQLTYLCKIRHKNFRIPQFKISYSVDQSSNNIMLLFPATKTKLIQRINNPHLTWYTKQQIQKVVPVNKHILLDIKKLRDFYPSIYEFEQSFILPFHYLNQQYELQFKHIDKYNIKMKICYERGNQDNAYELLEEYAFLLGSE